MTTSDMLKRQVDEHNAQVKAAHDRLADKLALKAELEAGFAEHEAQTRKFNAWAMAKLREIIAADENHLAELGRPIDTLDTPTASLLDMRGLMRSSAQ